MLKRCVTLICLLVSVIPVGASREGSSSACTPAGPIMRLAGLPEASGLVVSRVTEGRLWAHNDSGKPEIFAIDTNGNVTGRVTVSGAAVEDWEAMGTGRCGSRTCLFIADIGDNSAGRKEIVIYRVPEPTNTSGPAQVDAVFRASYPDGAHDAEALLAAPDGSLYIVTKGDTGHVALYRFPGEMQEGRTMRLERVGVPLSSAKPADHDRITDGAISADGQWVVLRTRSALSFYRASEFLKGNFRKARSVDLTPLAEPQGEAVAFGSANRVYVAGEGGGKSRPGTLALLSCVN